MNKTLIVISVTSLLSIGSLAIASEGAPGENTHKLNTDLLCSKDTASLPAQTSKEEEAALLIEQGISESENWNYNAAISKFNLAIKASDEILQATPADLSAQKTKARASSEQGFLQHRMCRYSLALASYAASTKTWGEALMASGNDLESMTGKAHAESRLLDLEATLGQYRNAENRFVKAKDGIEACLNHTEAKSSLRTAWIECLLNCGRMHRNIGSYKESEAEYTRALEIANLALRDRPADATVKSCKRNILLHIARLQLVLGHLDKADSLANQVIDHSASTGDRAYRSRALLQLAYALFDKAVLQTKTGHCRASIPTYDQAVQACDGAIEAVPSNLEAMALKANVLNSKSAWLFAMAEYADSSTVANLATEVCGKGLQLAPESIELLRSKGNALLTSGRLAAQNNQDAESMEYFSKSINTFDQALKIAPCEVYVLTNKSFAFQCLAAQLMLNDKDACQRSFKLALATAAEAKTQTPENIEVMNSFAYALQTLPASPGLSKQIETKATLYDRALEAYNAVLKLNPDDVPALKGKGNVLREIAKNPKLSTAEKESALKQAIATFNQAIELWPADTFVYGYRGKAQFSLGSLQASISENDSKASYKEAVASFKKAIQLNSGNQRYCEDDLKNAGLILQGKRPTYVSKEILERLKKKLTESDTK